MKTFDWHGVAKDLAAQLKHFLGGRPPVLGISGGIDSAVVGWLCKEAGASPCLFVWMPYGDPHKGELLAHDVACKWLGKSLLTVDITAAVDAAMASVDSNFQEPMSRLAKGNLMARQRMCALYAIANRAGGIVVGTGNKTEIMVGYGTKHGDEACDVQPIGSLYKTAVRAIAETLPGIPRPVIDQAPSAGLWDGQTDENEMGITYDLLDALLFGAIQDHPGETCDKVKNMITGSAHKRRMPPIFVPAVSQLEVEEAMCERIGLCFGKQ